MVSKQLRRNRIRGRRPAAFVASVIALQIVIIGPARAGLDLIKAIFQHVVGNGGENRDLEVEVHPGGGEVTFGHRPIKAEHAFIAINAGTRAHDVVARFRVVIGLVCLTKQNVMANNRRVEEQFRIFARDGFKPAAAFDPVIAFVAKQKVLAVATKDKVVTLAPKGFGGVLAKDDVIIAFVTEHKVSAAGFGDHVIALIAAQHIVAKGVFDDIITLAPEHIVRFGAAIKVIVATVAPKGINAAVAHQGIVALGAAQHIMLAALNTQVAADVVINSSDRHSGGTGIVAHHFRPKDRFGDRIKPVP